MGHGLWVMGIQHDVMHDVILMGHRCWVMSHGYWVMGFGCWVMGTSWVVGFGS